MKKILKTFLRGLIFCLSRDLPLEGRKPFTRTLTIEYTFIRYVPERGRKSQPNEGAQPQNTSAIHKGFGDIPQQTKWEASAVRGGLPIIASV